MNYKRFLSVTVSKDLQGLRGGVPLSVYQVGGVSTKRDLIPTYKTENENISRPTLCLWTFLKDVKENVRTTFVTEDVLSDTLCKEILKSLSIFNTSCKILSLRRL